MSVKVELLIAALAIVIPTVLSIIGAAWIVAQMLGALCQRVQAIEEIVKTGFAAAEEKTELARSEAEAKVVAVHARINAGEAAHNHLASRLDRLKTKHNVFKSEYQKHTREAGA